MYFCANNYIEDYTRMQDREAFYKNLKAKLKEGTKFPAKYLFKFIVKGQEKKEKEIESIFDHMGAVITKNKSKTGKYISVSIIVTMKSADAVIEKYLEAEKIEGIISL